MNDTYPINEVFETMQGEAGFTGSPAIFIRFQGCPVGCPWCDTKHTWASNLSDEVPAAAMLAKTEDSPKFARMSVDDIVAMVRSMQSRHVVITGGEPCMFDLNPLVDALVQDGRTVQIETSGTFEILADGAFVTVSPKVNMPGGLEVQRAALLRADEIKMPVGREADVRVLLDLLSGLEDHERPVVWLQPLSQSPKATRVCMDLAREHGFRVSVQTHKFLGVR